MRVVVVEDDPLVAAGLQLTLEDIGHEVCAIASTARRALEAIERCRPDFITCDRQLRGGGSGLDVAREAFRLWGIRALFISGSVDEEFLAMARQADSIACLDKSLPAGRLTDRIAAAVCLIADR
ncbi:response regulator [Arenibaculum pallidiluteum]|uniref:response regulator n=1 Tax=Arenibaculum pallidiluteum TaxID=2812559 RepID=UPI001A96C78F|nr:response regulator [Arenibaculum pallidiluteum]